ncbi:hypothetical protein LZ31DRAFT_546941 [Colletotrichum somersetense]|nr:hypothetical protein LZ31DRAFT_546941 [Colletotrichum somersetense]
MGEWACSPAALSALKPAFSDAQRLAQAAIDALQVPGVETSDAFENWFGDIFALHSSNQLQLSIKCPKAEDVQNPNDSGSGCYSPGCCAALPGADKIRNAQNYALFALDVLAFPERAKPQSRACGRPVPTTSAPAKVTVANGATIPVVAGNEHIHPGNELRSPDLFLCPKEL